MGMLKLQWPLSQENLLPTQLWNIIFEVLIPSPSHLSVISNSLYNHSWNMNICSWNKKLQLFYDNCSFFSKERKFHAWIALLTYFYVQELNIQGRQQHPYHLQPGAMMQKKIITIIPRNQFSPRWKRKPRNWSTHSATRRNTMTVIAKRPITPPLHWVLTQMTMKMKKKMLNT